MVVWGGFVCSSRTNIKFACISSVGFKINKTILIKKKKKKKKKKEKKKKKKQQKKKKK